MNEELKGGETRGAGEFPVTRWTRVLAARGDSAAAKAALSDLCAAYYVPVRAFIGHHARNAGAATADDLTQAFFTQVLGHSGIGGVERGRGRFRSYLLGAVKHFLSDWRDRERAEKRGGGREMVSLDEEKETGTSGGGASSLGDRIADARAEVSDAYFDRQWALAVLERSLGEVANAYAEAGKEKQFAVLKAWLTGDAAAISQAEAAAELGISEGAVKVAIHRLRKRLRSVLKREVAETLEDDAEVGAELRYLVEALGG